MSSYLEYRILRTPKRTETTLSKSLLPRAFLLSCTFDRHARDFTHELDASLRSILCQPGWKFLKTPMAKYRSEGVRARGLASGSLSHTVHEFSRTASTLSKLSLCKRPPGTPEMEGLPELEGARTGGRQNWRGCPYWRKVPILEQGKNLSFSFPHTNIFNIGSALNFPA